MKNILQRGFTLIELLVVIAIIGILAAVVLASLNDARDTGQDASLKQSIGNARSQAELVYNKAGANQYSYTDVCTDPNVVSLLEAARDQRSETVDVVDAIGTASDGDSVTCHSNASGYAIIAPLNVNAVEGTVDSWCVDSTGFAGQVAVDSVGANEVACN